MELTYEYAQEWVGVHIHRTKLAFEIYHGCEVVDFLCLLPFFLVTSYCNLLILRLWHMAATLELPCKSHSCVG